VSFLSMPAPMHGKWRKHDPHERNYEKDLRRNRLPTIGAGRDDPTGKTE